MAVTLSTFIRERRQNLDLTQEHLAERVGDPVRQAETSRLERDQIALPHRDRLVAIATALEVSLDDLRVATGWEMPNDRHPGLAQNPALTQERGAAQQMQRKHVVIVNSDPAFLDAARRLLQSNAFNVTTTNLLPTTFQMIQAVTVDAIVIDVAFGQPQIWSLVEQLHWPADAGVADRFHLDQWRTARPGRSPVVACRRALCDPQAV